ncbi:MULTISPECIES: tetratricopeptide repeat protein [unclassified Streptomyces]|uniref:tetratricopeptide repeat protein n=1 Tax=unclassified Streptomyces TaxID=2593676 RepID=UPI0033E16728
MTAGRSGEPQPHIEQRVTATAGFAYGTIGADIHVFGDGTPVYLLARWRPSPEADAEWLSELPSRMLNARFSVVPFTGRKAELAVLRQWRDNGPRLAVRWLHAPGGQGKTRLAARFVRESAEAGWQAVTAVHGPGAVQPPPGSQDLRTGDDQGLVLLVDYADRWPLTHLTWLLSNALLHRPGVRTRVLLLARTAESWPAVRGALANHQAGTSIQQLGELPDGSEARADMYAAAHDAFASRYGLPVPGRTLPPPGPLDQPGFGLTLTLHMAALVAVDAHVTGRRPPSEMAGLTVYLLDREHLQWAQLFSSGGRPAQRPAGSQREFRTPPQVMNHTVFAAALIGPVSSRAGVSVVEELSAPLPAPQVLADHSYCYPPPEPDHGSVLEPLYPDRLAEDFLALTLPGHTADYPAMPWSETTVATLLSRGGQGAAPLWAPRAVTFLTAAAQRWPHVGSRYLYPLLDADPALALAAGSAALSALAALDDVPPELLAAVESHFPLRRHVDLDAGIASVASRLLQHRLGGVDGDDLATRAAEYRKLGNRLSNAGLHERALEAFEQAVTACRPLAAQDAALYEPELAAALTHLGTCLALLGRGEEALAATQQAVSSYRRLAAARPETYEGLYAGTLSNVGLWLAMRGRRQEALAASEESVAVWRRMAAADPAREEFLAQVLHNHGNQLSDMGRPADAADALRQAVAIRRRLADQDPATYEPDLADSLINLANHLAAQGKRSEALESSWQATELYRRLAKVNPEAHEGNLAIALTSLGADLAEGGRRDEAIGVTEESVALRRRLAAGNLVVYEPLLAQSLSNLGWFRLSANRPAEALEACEEAVAIRERLAAAEPDVHRADLAQSLTHLGACLARNGRPAEGLRATVRSAELYRHAVADNPAAYTLELARALNNIGRFLALASRWKEALAAVDEALTLAHRTASANPLAYANLVGSLRDIKEACLRRQVPGASHG